MILKEGQLPVNSGFNTRSSDQPLTLAHPQSTMSTSIQSAVSAYRYIFPSPAHPNPYYHSPSPSSHKSGKEAEAVVCSKGVCSSTRQCRCDYVEALEASLMPKSTTSSSQDKRDVSGSALAVDILVCTSSSRFNLSVHVLILLRGESSVL